MARKLRIQYPGAVYHVMNRGDRREPIFRDDEDRRRFWETLGETCGKTGWQAHAVCLMPNHFHLVVETPRGNLVEGMKWLLGTYTMRFNRRHRLIGHLFAGRYKALIVHASGSGYLKTACDYVHLNPSRAGLLESHLPLASFPWSSWPEYLKLPAERWAWLRTDRLLGEYGVPEDSASGRKRIERALEARRSGEKSDDLNALRQGWCLGDAEFRRELIAGMVPTTRNRRGGPDFQEGEDELAERLVTEELARLGWTNAELARRRKGDPEKIRVARKIRSQTTKPLKWIAQRLRMGSPGMVSHCLRSHSSTGSPMATRLPLNARSPMPGAW